MKLRAGPLNQPPFLDLIPKCSETGEDAKKSFWSDPGLLALHNHCVTKEGISQLTFPNKFVFLPLTHKRRQFILY